MTRRAAIVATAIAVLGAPGTLATLATVVTLGACKRHRDAPPPPAAPPADAAIDVNLDACRDAAARIPGLPPARRAQALLDACQPCGDWQPLLQWNTPAREGGPRLDAIERAMLACRAYCEPGAKQRFLGTLDAARGQDTRGPWRHLGEICKAEVSAVPDARYMGAPYFALDRIARALGGALGGAPAIELPLPALSISAVGIELPSLPATATNAETGAAATGAAATGAAATSAAATGAATELVIPPGPAALTLDAAHVFLGTLPSARLTATGLVVSGDYPGEMVELRRLAAALAAPALAGHPIAVLAPRALPAARIAEVVAAAGGRDLQLAVALPGPGGWILPGALPIALTTRSAAHAPRLALGADPGAAIAAAATAAPIADPPAIAIDRAATAEGLAALLGALAAAHVASAALVAPPAKP